MNPLAEGFMSAVRPTDRRPPWQWAEDHFEVDKTSPMPGKFRAENAPWIKPLMEDFADNKINDISVRCSAQSSKTQTLMICACWAIAEDPGPAMWVMAAKDEAEPFVRDRIGPSFKTCKPVSDLLIRESKLEFTFATMPFYFTGAGSPSKLQSKPIRWLFLDEVRNYPPKALDTVLKRTRAFWNSRRVIISTPDMKDDAVDRAFLLGDQRTFHFPCPACATLQPLMMKQLRWDTDENTKPGGVWNFDRLAESIRYVCVGCGHAMKDEPVTRKLIARSGHFVRMNPNAPRHRVSYTWSALLPPWVSWRSVVEEFLTAQDAARKGDLSPLKTFVNETLGEPWEDKLGEIDDFDFIRSRCMEYDYGEKWSEERVRFMAADKQAKGGEHYWYVIRAFGLFGKSRLVAYGKCNSYVELVEIQKQHGVLSQNCIIDSGFMASQVYRFCASNGWKAFKGDDVEFFLLRDVRTQKTYRQVWRMGRVDPNYGTKEAGRARPIPLFQWANNPVKDLLAEFMTGLVGEWTLPQTIGADYLKQATAERRDEFKDAFGRVKFRWVKVREDDHLRDCELMILVGAIASKVLSTPPRALATSASPV